MWQELGILLGGYGFIVLSYALVWVIATGMSRYMSAERVRVGKADVKAVAGIAVFWTIAFAIMMFMDRCD